MRMMINKKPDGEQLPVLCDASGKLSIGSSNEQPSQLYGEEKLQVMLACANNGWEWEKIK